MQSVVILVSDDAFSREEVSIVNHVGLGPVYLSGCARLLDDYARIELSDCTAG